MKINPEDAKLQRAVGRRLKAGKPVVGLLAGLLATTVAAEEKGSVPPLAGAPMPPKAEQRPNARCEIKKRAPMGKIAAPRMRFAETNNLELVSAARQQIGVTVRYVGDYQKLAYPNGDVPREQGVCVDVIIRAMRDTGRGDLQQLVHEDMKANFAAYPKIWGLTKPDPNIDHRRVLNLQCYFKRMGYAVTVTDEPSDYRPGDFVTCFVGRRPHIMLVSDRKASDGKTPLVIHNIGAGAKEEDRLFAFPLTGHYRLR